MLYLTKVNVNTTLTQLHGFCKVMVAKKACPIIYWFDILRTCRDDSKSVALSDVKCLSFVIVYLNIPVAGFDSIFDCYLGMLGCFLYLHMVKSTPINHSYNKLGFLFFILTFTSHFTLKCLFIL